MAKKTEAEIREGLREPLSDDPTIRFRQQVERKALILQKKGGPKRRAQVLEPKPKPKTEPKKKEAKKGTDFFDILEELRKKGRK